MVRLFFLFYTPELSAGIDTFRTIEENNIQSHYENILNFFDNRYTNASAESFNAKIKAFRRQIRGVVDVTYFLFQTL